MWTKLFRKRKLQTVMIFLVVLLCTTLLNGSMTVLTSLGKPYKELKEECNPADLSVYMYTYDENVINQYKDRFRELEEVESIADVKYLSIDDEVYVGDKKITAFLHLDKYNNNAYKKLRYVDGSKDIDKDLKENTCFIPACIQNEFNLKVGDTLSIKNSKKELNYKIAGVIAEPYSTSTAFDASIFVNDLPEGFTNVKTIMKVFAKDGYTGEDIQAAYQKINKGVFLGIVESVDEVIDGGLIAINIVSALFLAIGIIMLVVSGLIINFMIRHTMVADAKSIAVYKTIGYTNSTILKMYLTFYFMITIVASILGIFCSRILADKVLGGVFANLGQSKEINVFYTGIWCILAVLGFVLLIVFAVIYKTKNIKPVYALNGLKNSNTRKKKHYSGKGNSNFSPIGIALRNIRRDKKGIIGILITISVTIFAVNFGIISLDVAYSQKDNNNYWIGVDASDVIINMTDSKDYDEIKNIVEKDKRVKKYYNASMGERVMFDWDKKGSAPAISAFVYEDYNKLELPMVEGRNPENSKEIAIGTRVADEQKKEVGDYIECYVGQGTKLKLLVVGIFQTYYQLGDSCRIRSDVYTDNNLEFGYNMCSIYLKDNDEREAFIDDLSKVVGNKGEVIPRTEAFSSIMNMIIEPQMQGIPPVIILAFFIGAINIFCIVMLKNVANEKNNGIYKSIGYSTADLIKANLYYVGIIAVISIAVAVPLCIAMYPSIMKATLSMFGFRAYPITINVIHMIIGNSCALIVFVVSTLVSSRSLYRIDVRDLVIE